MSRKARLRGTRAYRQGSMAFEDAGPGNVIVSPYSYGDNHEAWKLGWIDAQREYADREAREPDDRMRELLNTIRYHGEGFGNDFGDAIAEAIGMIWEKVK